MNDQNGYIKLWRKSLEKGWLANHELWVFWTWCLLRAAHQERDVIIGNQTVHLKPGEFVFGLASASQQLNLSIQQIRTILKFLKREENLTIKSTNKFSVISIVNWEIYQADNGTTNKQTNKRLTSKQQATNNKQECKECKNEKNKINKADFVLPETIKPEVWEAFLEMRKAIKKPATLYAQKSIIKKLANMEGDPNRILEQSIENSWQGVFPLKTNSIPQGGRYERKPYDTYQRDPGYAAIQRAFAEADAITAEYERRKALKAAAGNQSAGDAQRDNETDIQS